MKSDMSGTMNSTVVAAPLRSGRESWRAAQDFLVHMDKTPGAPALRVDGAQLSYQALGELSQGLARAVQTALADAPAIPGVKHGATHGATHGACAIYADRSVESYAGVLAALQLGLSYVPLNPKFPDERNRILLERSGAGCVICAPAAQARMQELTRGTGVQVVAAPVAGAPLAADLSNPVAYILFTSGSTGTPKGVPISHANLDAYLSAAMAVTDYGPQDRFSQNFDLTFDLSVHDMFLCWRVGAELIVPSFADLEQPADYVQREGVTCWFSVPSLAQKMNLQHSLKPGALSGICHSLFCGEALPLDLAVKWQAATGSAVENWYGPTEATIACMRYVLPAEAAGMQTHLGLTPIGDCLPDMRALVLDETLQEVPLGGTGELYMAGPQLAQGYLDDPEKTAAAFVDLPQFGGRFYRTGDRVKRVRTEELHFIDRADNQIKIRGYRVEIGEIEALIRDLSGGCTAVVTPLPLKSPTPTVLVASIEGWQGDSAALLGQLGEALPTYMVPSALRQETSFPKNASGKVDRGAIGAALAAQTEAETAAAPVALPAGGKVETQNMRRQLIALARQINPALSREEILNAPDLMAAGLDSLAFAEFSVRIEKSFGLALNQNLVAEMAEMRIGKLAKLVKHLIDPQREARPGSAAGKGAGRRAGVGKGAQKTATRTAGTAGGKRGKNPERKTVHYKSRRTVECLDHFPAWAEAAEHPLALFFGSSGIMGGIGTEVVEARSAALGQPVSAANLGMAKLSNAGTVELIEYVRDVLRDLGKPVAFGVYELELMQLSPLPTGREIEVVKAYLSGDYVLEELANVDPWNRWDSASGGTILRGGNQADQAGQVDQAVAATAQWSKKREQEVTDAYLGRLEFIAMQRQIWLQGAHLAESFCPRLLSFVHPVSAPALEAARARPAGPHLDSLLNSLDEALRSPLMRPGQFDLNPQDYRDYNHSNRFEGRRKLSEQLTEAALIQQLGQ